MESRPGPAINHFQTHGWVRIAGAFSADAAAAMRDVVWRALAERGIHRDDPATWTEERPQHLQHLKSDPAFRAVASDRTLAAIDEVLGGQPWRRPKDWGAFFLVFPALDRRPWDVPDNNWHLDADYTGPLWPPKGVKVHAMLGDVAPRAGGMPILSGSHRLVHRWFEEHPPKPDARAADNRASVHRHPYMKDLCTPGEAAGRIARFHASREEVDGIPLQVLENTASAGDVILMHPLLLHSLPVTHLGTRPRFLINKDIFL